jgi:hypothetical protein
MNSVKKIGKNIVFVLIPLLVLFILLEILSRLFFPGSDRPREYYDTENNIVKYGRENGTRGMWTVGNFAQQRGKWRINNDGWNSPIDYTPAKTPGVKRIAVIGDSYIEAWQVDAEKKYPSLLDKMLGDKYEVYSFGVSASPLSQYVHMSRYVEKKYSPDVYIFNLVHNDFHQSINGLTYTPFMMTVKLNADSTFTEVQPVKPERAYSKMPAGDLLKKSSFFRYVYENLQLKQRFISKAGAKEVEMNVPVSDMMNKKDSIRRVTAYLLGRIKAELGGKEIIFVMDAPRQNIYHNDLAASKVAWLNETVGGYCKDLGMDFIDLTPYMEEDYKKNQTHFESKYDNHWSQYGHQFVANVVYNYFKNKN